MLVFHPILKIEPEPFQGLAASHRPFAIRWSDNAYNRRRVFDIVTQPSLRRKVAPVQFIVTKFYNKNRYIRRIALRCTIFRGCNFAVTPTAAPPPGPPDCPLTAALRR